MYVANCRHCKERLYKENDYSPWMHLSINTRFCMKDGTKQGQVAEPYIIPPADDPWESPNYIGGGGVGE